MKKLLSAFCGGVFLVAGAAYAGERGAERTVAAAIADKTRLKEHVARDEGRKPLEVLSFAGVKAGNKVADLAAGAGYYTALLSRIVGDAGKIYAVDPVRIFEAFPNARETFPGYLKEDPRGNVDYSVQKFDALKFDAPLDLVVMGLYYHDTVWTRADRAAMNKAIFDALKPGGTYLVIDHLAVAGADEAVTRELHRMVPGVVKPEVLAAGFEFAGETDVLANPDDPRDASVFDEALRGKTDRFVYLFRKP
ncbi:MAG: methyltransferase domain-containing protein [Pseudomonadota bacterium]